MSHPFHTLLHRTPPQSCQRRQDITPVQHVLFKAFEEKHIRSLRLLCLQLRSVWASQGRWPKDGPRATHTTLWCGSQLLPCCTRTLTSSGSEDMLRISFLHCQNCNCFLGSLVGLRSCHLASFDLQELFGLDYGSILDPARKEGSESELQIARPLSPQFPG